MQDNLNAWVRNKAFSHLSKRDMTEHELYSALYRKARTQFSVDDDAIITAVNQAIERCHELNLINDSRFAETKASNAVRTGKSKRALEQALTQKGIAPALVVEATSNTDDRTAALNYCRKRGLGPYRRKVMSDQRQAARELSSLMRQGFEMHLAMQVLNLSSDDLENAIDETTLHG